ncbi:hypothetical protein DFJ58DRAFT_735407 [Suillus subalutaceus]|uniref:uncharacterized protein n=1 Tax=Suillus subalutaceus TaxID=48586 RepID=UPI001B87C24A|nr:uncharacterized protein DFJ58DRAFT_735407 [Suillus subalutaceus]KAG1835895.1 hypothetical protein DFJ58DRAFT_735407 [Suillus subalutaceus]
MSIPVFKPFMRDGDRYLTATDAFCVATYGHRVITTPNMKFIPQPFDNESDIIQAQRRCDFTPISPGNPFGQLKTDIVGHLKRLYEKANTRVSNYKVARSHKEDHVVGWAHAMRAVYERFQQAMAWRDIVIIVAEYQRRFLDIWAVIDYYEIIEPRMRFVDTTHKVHAAGVPVWLIRDARLVNANMNIVKVVSFTPPDDLVIGMYHDPVKLFAQPFDIINRGSQ